MTDGQLTEEDKAAEAEVLAEIAAFNAEAIRKGFFACADDMMSTMHENGIERPDIALLDGAVLFLAQLWDDTMVGAGHSPSKSKQALLDNIRKGINTARARRQQPAILNVKADQ